MMSSILVPPMGRFMMASNPGRKTRLLKPPVWRAGGVGVRVMIGVPWSVTMIGSSLLASRSH